MCAEVHALTDEPDTLSDGARALTDEPDAVDSDYSIMVFFLKCNVYLQRCNALFKPNTELVENKLKCDA